MANYLPDQVISVIMPVYNQASFIGCAIASLLRQTYDAWELIIINDGSTDNLNDVLSHFLEDERIKYFCNDKNEGLGYSLNRGIDIASHEFIAYLPSDDIYFNNHLESLMDLQNESDSDLVYSGIIYNKKNIGGESSSFSSKGRIDDISPFKLVQVLHKKTNDRWLERKDLVTDDLDRMFWKKYMENHTKVSATNKITCEWVSHLYQRSNIMNDRGQGGIYMYKTYYGVKEPIRYQSAEGNYVDQIDHFKYLRSKNINADKSEGLKILLVGELAYNPERIMALEERGHKLYGLWINNPLNFNTVGPLPFGNVEDIPFDNWEESIKEIQPDIIYALLNFQAISLAHIVLTRNPGIPFIWHFKEGPFYCRTLGLWEKLIDLYTKSDGVIYTNEMIRRWFSIFLPSPQKPYLIIDGDLPKKDWFKDNRQSLLSEKDGRIHTVVAGRVFGITADDIMTMADQEIHLHIYGDVFHYQSKAMLDEAMALAPDHVHLHSNCPQENWVSEFSQYDAGWLHYFRSRNNGDILRANWADINSPARMATYAMAGVPMLMHDNSGHLVHHQQYLESLNMAITFDSFSGLRETFDNSDKISEIRRSTWDKRYDFCFDTYADDLIAFFKEIILTHSSKG